MNTPDQILAKLNEQLGTGRVIANKDISHFFTLRAKTSAEFYFEAETGEDWKNVFKTSSQYKIPLFIVGGGSNIAVTKNMLSGLVVRNLYLKKEIIKTTDAYTELLISSGYPVSRLVKEMNDAGLGGIEYHMGLPGTVGGAIYMNSKWTWKQTSYFGDNLREAVLITKEGEEKKVNHDYFNFAYDYSILQKTGEFFLEGIFRFKKEDKSILSGRSLEAQEYRRKTQPPSIGTCGCFFQNITEEEKEKHNLPTKSAGYLIDKAGLKNVQIGDFIVSDKHANFIINKGDGKPEDLVKMITTIKDRVKEKFGIDLKEEVEIV